MMGRSSQFYFGLMFRFRLVFIFVFVQVGVLNFIFDGFQLFLVVFVFIFQLFGSLFFKLLFRLLNWKFVMLIFFWRVFICKVIKLFYRQELTIRDVYFLVRFIFWEFFVEQRLVFFFRVEVGGYYCQVFVIRIVLGVEVKLSLQFFLGFQVVYQVIF